MSIASPVTPSWFYDFGDTTSAALATYTPAITGSLLTAAKSAAVSMINSGAYGSTTALYRVTVRADANTGYSVQLELTV